MFKKSFTELQINPKIFLLSLKEKHNAIEFFEKRNLQSIEFVKEIVDDENVLHRLESSAISAWNVACQTVLETNIEFRLQGSGKHKTTIAFGAFEYEYEFYSGKVEKREMTPYTHVKNGLVSRIFYERWQKCASQFWQKLEDFEGLNSLTKSLKQYTFTGFGIGAVIAVFAALEYKRKYEETTITLITFGQPRIGNEHFAYYIERIFDKSWRVINGDDWVPNFPIDGNNRFQLKEKMYPEKRRKKFPRVLYKHFRREFWIEPPCDCSSPKIYACYHTASLDENKDCNARNNFLYSKSRGCSWLDGLKYYRDSHPDDQHFGPYFQHTMFQNCPSSI
ncbi:hypothetical protein G9A89_003535 [Geosiphon pyriformis]|nr:hypothetical protein G9A89_003535 [Geosiphon pyriformis]